MATTTYTVIDYNSCDPIARGCDLAEAAHIILTDDGHDYEIRRDDYGYILWTRKEVANEGWTMYPIYSVEDSLEAAEADIYQQVVEGRYKNTYDTQPEAIADEEYDAMLAEIEEEEGLG